MKGRIFLIVALWAACIGIIAFSILKDDRLPGTCRSQLNGEQIRGELVLDGDATRWEMRDLNRVAITVDQSNTRDWICMTDKEAGI